MSSSSDLLSSARTERPAPPRFFGLLKATSVFLATALLAQGVTAGILMSDEDGRRLHATMGSVVSFALLLQLVAAFLVWRVGRGSMRYLAVSALLLVFTGVQFAIGTSGDVAVHVPLGVALFGAGAVLTAQVWARTPN